MRKPFCFPCSYLSKSSSRLQLCGWIRHTVSLSMNHVSNWVRDMKVIWNWMVTERSKILLLLLFSYYYLSTIHINLPPRHPVIIFSDKKKKKKDVALNNSLLKSWFCLFYWETFVSRISTSCHLFLYSNAFHLTHAGVSVKENNGRSKFHHTNKSVKLPFSWPFQFSIL